MNNDNRPSAVSDDQAQFLAELQEYVRLQAVVQRHVKNSPALNAYLRAAESGNWQQACSVLDIAPDQY